MAKMDTQLETRIKQWETMCHEAPDDMAWLSLGNAYKQAQRLTDAARAFAEAIKLNPGMSRAYQARGEALIEMNQPSEAANVLTDGYIQAAQRGDVMPQKAMAKLLEQLGKPVPEVKQTQAPAPIIDGEKIVDRRTGQTGDRMPEPPMRGPIGLFITDHFSAQTWREWISMGTKVINELRLDFAMEQHQKVYEDQMLEWLGVSREEIEQYASEKSTAD